SQRRIARSSKSRLGLRVSGFRRVDATAKPRSMLPLLGARHRLARRVLDDAVVVAVGRASHAALRIDDDLANQMRVGIARTVAKMTVLPTRQPGGLEAQVALVAERAPIRVTSVG